MPSLRRGGRRARDGLPMAARPPSNERLRREPPGTDGKCKQQLTQRPPRSPPSLPSTSPPPSVCYARDYASRSGPDYEVCGIRRCRHFGEHRLYNTVAGEGPAQRTFHGLKGGHMPVLRSVSHARLRTPLRLLALLAVGGRSSAGHSRSHPEPHPIRHSFSRPPERLADLTPLLLQERKE